VRQRLLRFAVASSVVLLPLAPWLIKSWVIVGNPLHPALHHLFKGDGWSLVQTMQMGNSTATKGFIGLPRNLTSMMTIPWDLVANTERWVDSDLSFSAVLLLFFVVAPFVPRSYRGVALVSALPGFLLWVLLPVTESRFLVALVPFMALTAVPLLCTLAQWRSTWIATAIVLLICLLLQWDLPRPPWSMLSSHTWRRALESRNLNRLWQHIEEKLPDDATVYLAFENRALFATREFRYDSTYEAPDSMALIRGSANAEEAVARFREIGITHLVIYWLPATRYLRQLLPYAITDPQLLPRDQFERERRIFLEMLKFQADHLFDFHLHSVFRLRPVSDRAVATPQADLTP
jgi:hypothetical protein